ncbi:MAG TPA: LD-carboxypeptidase [Polyangiaceae bacterium]|nr:LD-carboxypeptidase [Polyangiaceae bacterium]
MIVPPPLRPGDVVAAFAGSSPFDPTLAWRGLAFLRSRYRVRFDRSLFERAGYLAGDDARRGRELERALVDPEVRALVAVRGGYGLSRVAHALDWGAVARSPRWVVGFSDVTALHVELARLGVASVHGPMIAALGRGDAWTRERWVGALEAPLAPLAFEGLRAWAPGRAEGPLVGGNLSLLHACAAAGRLALPPSAVVLLEDVGERPYRLDRMLTTLAEGGHFRGAAGFLVGDFNDCGPGPDGTRAEDVLRERLGRLGVPVLAGAPVGHERYNHPVVLGRRWRLDAAARAARAL